MFSQARRSFNSSLFCRLSRSQNKTKQKKDPDCRLVILPMDHLTFFDIFYALQAYFLPEICQVKTSGKLYEIKSSQA